MLLHRLLVRRESSRLKCVLKQTRHTSTQVVPELERFGSGFELRLSAHKPKKPTREPFVKNLFIGKFDKEILTYPESQTYERHREFFEWLKPIEDYINERVDIREIDRTAVIKKEIFDDLNKLGVLRAPVEEIYGGLGLNSSEYAKLVETLSAVPVLGSFMIRRSMVIKLIHKFGSEEQKADLLPKIARGEIRPALCFSESPTGSIGESLSSKATLSECRNFVSIQAEKTFVFDASAADLFVVIAPKESSDKFVKKELLSAFLIPRHTPGVEIKKPMRLMGQKGIELCDITFNVTIPKEGQLGDDLAESDLFVSVMGEGRGDSGAQAIGITKRFLNILCSSLRANRGLNSKLQQEDSLHGVIGKIASNLYAMEAVTYMTAGMRDNFENQDTLVEQTLVECFCTQLSKESILQSLGVLGAPGYSDQEPFEQIIRDVLTLDNNGSYAGDIKVFAALSGLQHVGQTLTDKVKTLRNPFFHPIELIKTALSIDPRTKHYLEEHLHPSLRVSAESLEQSVFNIRKCVEELFVRHGLYLTTERMELIRLSEILVEVYAMTAVVARASRAYCIGLRNCDDEVKVAMYFTYQTYERVKSLVTEVLDGNWSNGDMVLKEVATTTFQEKKYFAAHPLERNF